MVQLNFGFESYFLTIYVHCRGDLFAQLLGHEVLMHLAAGQELLKNLPNTYAVI